MLLGIKRSPEGRSGELEVNSEMGALHSSSCPTLTQPVGDSALLLQLEVLSGCAFHFPK